jgi:hypothetical protein
MNEMIDDTLPFDHGRPVKEEDLKVGLQVWATILNCRCTVRSIVPEQSVVFMSAHGNRITTPMAALGSGLYYHLHEQQPDAHQELRVEALRLIDQGHRILKLIDQLEGK